jgi:hypothetical protein
MQEQEWKEFEIKNFLGIATSNRNPNKEECSECKNLDLREIDGDLNTRGGYAVKYIAPVDSRGMVSNIATKRFANFYIPDIGGGREITCSVRGGTIAGETGGTYSTPTSINSVLIWIRPYWTGVAWVDAWQWLNQTIITKIHTVNTDKYKIKLDMTDTDVIDDALFDGWTIYNATKESSAQVIKTYDYGTNEVGIKITNDSHNWAAEDVVYLIKNFIPLAYMTEMYNATSSEVSFHKVLNDLRIGFGGKENRIGLSVGYRKKYWKFDSFDFGTGDSDLTDSSAKEAFSTIDAIILDPYIPVNYISSLNFVTSSGTLPAGKYTFKIVGLLDDFNYIILNETEITTETIRDIIVSSRFDWATKNKRLTEIIIFWADSNNVFYELIRYRLTQATYNEKIFKIDNTGNIVFPTPSAVNLITDSNAVLPGTDANATTGWSAIGTGSIASVTGTPTPQNGTYCLKITPTAPGVGKPTVIVGAEYSMALDPGDYNLKLYVNSEKEVTIFYGFYVNGVDVVKSLVVGTTWQEIDEVISVPSNPAKFIIYFNGADFDTDWLALDNFRMTKGEYKPSLEAATEQQYELADTIGYTPTTDYIKTWEQAIITQGKTFLINPYIDKKYDNKIFFSHISGVGAFEYDVITAENYFDLENFDGNNLIGIELLPNGNFLALKSNSAQQINSQTGETINIKIGAGCISRRSIVNFGDKVAWCGETGIWMSDGLNYRDISDKAIRDQYRSLTANQKAAIIATREEKDNVYRLFTGDTTNKTEFVFTKKGWVKVIQNSYPEDYTIAKDGTTWFVRSGVIYDKTTGTADNTNAIAYSWKSVPIDISLAGESVTANMVFYLDEVWLYFTQLSSLTVTIKIFLNGSSTEFQSITTSYTTAGKRLFRRQLKLGANCRSFQIEVSGSDSVGAQVSIHSVGVLYKIARIPGY